ncbi:hypothetical protein CR513_53847, partial [Mucuna pruriens]
MTFVLDSPRHNALDSPRHNISPKNTNISNMSAETIGGRDRTRDRPRNRNINWAALFKETCTTDLITLLRSKRLAHNIDKTKYYCYHRNYGHTTKGCVTLRDKIEKLIQANEAHDMKKLRGGVRTPDKLRHLGEKGSPTGEAPQDSKALLTTSQEGLSVDLQTQTKNGIYAPSIASTLTLTEFLDNSPPLPSPTKTSSD